MKLPPQVIELLLWLLQDAVATTPYLAAEIINLLSKPEPTADDWKALRERVSKTYADYVPDSELPPPS